MVTDPLGLTGKTVEVSGTAVFRPRKKKVIISRGERRKHWRLPKLNQKPKKKRRKNKKSRHKRRGPINYHEYINSKAWLRRRLMYYDTYGQLCAVCGIKADHLHHKSYERLGKELDDDLVPLCEFHHDDFHSIYGSFLDMRLATDTYIASKRQDIEADNILRTIC